MSRIFCHTCGATTTIVNGDPPMRDGEYVCPTCIGTLVEFIENRDQEDELRSFAHNYPPTTALPQQQFHVQQQPGGTVVVVSSVHPLQYLQQQYFQPYAGGSSGGAGSGVLPNAPPSLADLLRHEVNLVHQAAMFGGDSGFLADDGAGMRELMHRILVQHQPNAQPTPAYVIDALVSRDSGLSAEEQAATSNGACAVCLEGMGAGDAAAGGRARPMKLLQLPCGHWFHDGCIRPWLGMSHTCPSCRRDVVAG